MRRVLIAAGVTVAVGLAGQAYAGNTSNNTSNNSSTNTSSDPWSSNSSSNSSDNQSGRRGRVDDYRRDERIDERRDGRRLFYRYDLFERYRTESGGWAYRHREEGVERERDDDD
jgi:hypothetical protein